MNKKTLILATIMLAAGILIGNIVIAPFIFTLLSSGTVVQNYGLTANPSTINWGNVILNENVTKQVDITNTGRDIASLNMTYNGTTNLLNYNLAWTAENLSLLSTNSLLANFTLIVYEFNFTATDQFSIDIWISDKG